MRRTNIVLDDTLVARAMKITGARSKREVVHLALRRLPRLEPGFATHVRAAALYRMLRARGVTVRGAVDCIIAATCLETGAALLTLDRDFEAIARHAGLRLLGPETNGE